MAITKSEIDRFKYKGGWDVRWDGGNGAITGFGVRIYSSGKKSFVFSYRADGRKRLMVLGGCAAMTVEQARKRAKAASVGVDDGVDPLGERQRKQQGETFKDLAVKFIDEHAKTHKKTWQEDEHRLDRHIPKSWLSRKVSAISVADVSSLHARIGSTRPYEANRFLAQLHIMFKLAKMPWQFLPASAPNPTDGIQNFPEVKRKRFVKPSELPYLAAAIDCEDNVYMRAAIWLYILTGLRKTELLSAKWNQVEWDLGRLRLPDTKSGEEQYATLSQTAMAILQGNPKLEGNPYVLPGAVKGHSLVNISKPWYRVREEATRRMWMDGSAMRPIIEKLDKALNRHALVSEIEEAAKSASVEPPLGMLDVRLHDLRRTVGSWLTQAGVDLNTIKDGLRHANISTTLTYARLGADPAREAMEDHGRRIMEAAGRAGPVSVGNDG